MPRKKQKLSLRSKAAMRMKKLRANLTQEQIAELRKASRERISKKRAMETSEEREQRYARDRIAAINRRLQRKYRQRLQRQNAIIQKLTERTDPPIKTKLIEIKIERLDEEQYEPKIGNGGKSKKKKNNSKSEKHDEKIFLSKIALEIIEENLNAMNDC